MKILRLETDWLRVPLRRSVSISSAQDARSVSDVDLLIVRLITDTTHVGLGYTYALGAGAAAIKSLLDGPINEIVQHQNPLQSEWLFVRAMSELHELGWHGLAARAYAAVDSALWDLKGKIAQLPVYQLLGGYRTKLKAVISDTATPAVGMKQAVRDTLAALERGAAGVQIEIGTIDPDDDAERLKLFREQIPDGAWFEVDARNRYDFASAVWLGTIGTEEFGLDSFCDPMRGHNQPEFDRLVDRLNVGVCVGSSFESVDEYLPYFQRGAISAVRVDPLRLGGITPARKLATIAEAHNVAIYPVRSPEIGTHLAAASKFGRMCESVDWFETVFAGGPQFQNQQLVVSDRPGLGLELRDEASKFRM